MGISWEEERVHEVTDIFPNLCAHKQKSPLIDSGLEEMVDNYTE
jgi:hypothetical protein